MDTTDPNASGRGAPWLMIAALLAALLWLGTAVLAWDRSFWFDEVYSLGAAAVGRPIDWALLRTDVHPPVYNLLVRAWGQVVGGDTPALRAVNLLGLIAYLAALALVWRVLGRERLAIFVCVTLCSGYALQLALDLRSYGVLLGFSALAQAFLLREVVLGRPQTFWLAGIAIALAALHFFGAAVGLSALGVSLLLHLRGGRRARAAIIAVICLGLAGAVIAYALGASTAAGKLTTGGNWIDLGLTPFLDFGAQQLALCFVLIVLLAHRHAPGRGPLLRRAALATLAVPAIVVLGAGLISLAAPVISTRNLTVCVPGVALAAAIACPDAALTWLRRTPVLAIVVLAAGLRYGETSIRNFQMIEWAAETATPAACDGTPLYTLDPGNVARFAQEVFLGAVKRPMIELTTFPRGGISLPEGCNILAVGWHQDGEVREVVDFFAVLGVRAEAQLPPDPRLAAKGLMTHGYVIRLAE